MKLILAAALVVCLCPYVSAQRYHEVVFPTVSVQRDIVYGSAPDYQGVNTELVLDVYQPDNDNASSRAVVVLVHGGGFTGGGKAGENFQQWGTDLARRGFVVASIEYRLGVESKTDAKAMWQASLRCGQDTRAAVRFLRSKKDLYRLDTSHIFLLGTSAGGFGILQASVLQDDEIPNYVDPSVGSAEGSSGTPGESSRVHGLVVCWGATTDTAFIEDGDPPIFAVHGTNDKTVPFQCGPSKFGFDLCGGEPLTNRAANLGIQTELLLFPGAGHTLDGDPILLDSCYRFAVRNLAGLTGVTTAVHETINDAKQIIVYPNPAQRGTPIVVQGITEGVGTVSVVDVLGRTVPCIIRQASPSSVQIEVLNSVPSACYVLIQHATSIHTYPIQLY